MAEPGRDRKRSAWEGEYSAFVEAHWARFLRLACLLTRDEHRGEELLQDCLVKLYVRWNKSAVQGDPAAYLRRMLANGNTDWWRRTRREQLVESPPDRPDAAASERVADVGVIAEQDLRRALRALPHGQRAVVVLRYCEDLTERETAAALGCSIGTVKSQNARAMARLRAQLVPRDTEERTITK